MGRVAFATRRRTARNRAPWAGVLQWGALRSQREGRIFVESNESGVVCFNGARCVRNAKDREGRPIRGAIDPLQWGALRSQREGSEKPGSGTSLTPLQWGALRSQREGSTDRIRRSASASFNGARCVRNAKAWNASWVAVNPCRASMGRVAFATRRSGLSVRLVMLALLQWGALRSQREGAFPRRPPAESAGFNGARCVRNAKGGVIAGRHGIGTASMGRVAFATRRSATLGRFRTFLIASMGRVAFATRRHLAGGTGDGEATTLQWGALRSQREGATLGGVGGVGVGGFNGARCVRNAKGGR